MKDIIFQGKVSNAHEAIDTLPGKVHGFDAIKRMTEELRQMNRPGGNFPDFSIRIVNGFENDVCFAEYRIDISSSNLASFSGTLMTMLKDYFGCSEPLVEVFDDPDPERNGMSAVEIVGWIVAG